MRKIPYRVLRRATYHSCRWVSGLSKVQLKQSQWLRQHPVEKLHALRRLAANASPLLDSSTANKTMEWTRAIPYGARLQVALSLLMWTRTLEAVQDTIARLHLPFATSERYYGSNGEHALVVRPYPTRRPELWVDPWTTVELKLDAERNPTGEQVPPPHTWDPERSPSLQDSDWDGMGTVEEDSIPVRKAEKETAVQRLHRVQSLTRKASEDDSVAQHLSDQQLRRRRRGYHSVIESSREEMPSVKFESEEEERYHGNILRGEGCPLNHLGCASPSPICVCVSHAKDILLSFVKAHAAILSALFVEGRTVRFTSNNDTLVKYVEFVFRELLEANFVSTQLLTDEATGASLPYFPSWATQEVLFLLPPKHSTFAPHQVETLASTIFQTVLVSPTGVTVAVESSNVSYLAPLKEKVETLLAFTKQKKVQWISLPNYRKGSSDTNRVNQFVESVGHYSKHLYAIQLLRVSHNSLIDETTLLNLVWCGLSTNTRCVSVNTSVWHSIFYFPHVPFLTKKVGNALRYRAVERTLLTRRVDPTFTSFPIAFLASLCGSFCRTTWLPPCHTALSFLPFLEDGDSTHNNPNTMNIWKHSSSMRYLQIERLIDYLLHPSLINLTALYTARWFGL